MIRNFLNGLVAAAGVMLSAHPAAACGERVEVRFFEADGDIFEINNTSRGPMALARLTIRLTGSRGRLIFDTEFGGPGASMAQPFEPLGGEVGLEAATPVGDGDEVMRLEFSGFGPGRRFEFIIDVDDRLDNSEFGQAVVSGGEIEGAGAEAVLIRSGGATSKIRGSFGADGRALLKGGVCA